MFEKNYHYDIVSPAVERFKDQGYTLDFDVEGDFLVSSGEKVPFKDVELTDVFHFENQEDLSDDSVVYAVSTKNGLKGVLVTGLGMCAEELKTNLNKLLVNRV
ncbi:hypothetical protein Pedsa_3054 [Pseudopedobacter saltans DSM 12145]|uniref:Phosphoribosylpyrophosphate synthetase n=1 Tax=Pseudopedobacter saltans (strain ATCC 51119 / DSM 12145 / JCM 21818 / CCUG 39354 / LMG 10337 / NBRC 100064 / NCIMB 13643) TaxID=762903 RepID=F0SA29_PSESL|nr:hypothetical protein [Pseudopedobacter saltans]ADY53593.1 hypothetical protein Pedsa_3054 [Pseudopedobacter saltans DSM 12145]